MPSQTLWLLKDLLLRSAGAAVLAAVAWLALGQAASINTDVAMTIDGGACAGFEYAPCVM